MKSWLIYSFITLFISTILVLSFKYVDIFLDNPEEIKLFIYLAFIIAGIVAFISLLLDRKRTRKNINNIINNKTDNKLLVFLVIGLALLLIGSNIFYLKAMSNTNNPSIPVIIINMNIILVLGLSLILFNSRINWNAVLGVFIAIFGVSMVVYNNNE